MSITLAQLKDIRSFLVPLWIEKQKALESIGFGGKSGYHKTSDEGMCRFTSSFLSEFMNENFEGDWEVAGGDVWPPVYTTGGFKDSDGNWNGHYWVTDGDVIIDFTASQFGDKEIVVTKINDPRYDANYSEDEIEEHLSNVSETVEAWLDKASNHEFMDTITMGLEI